MMLEPSVNVIKTKADSRYTLAILAAKRARDIIDGKPQLIEEEMEKPVSIAAHEIAGDLITYTRDEADEIEDIMMDSAAPVSEAVAEETVEEEAAEEEIL